MIYKYSEVVPAMPLYENLWNNNDVIYKGSTLYFPNWIQNGIMCVADLLLDGVLMPVEEVINKVGNKAQTLLQYNVVMNAIPREWIPDGYVDGVLNRAPLFWDEEITKMTTRQIRKRLAGVKYKTSTGELFWSKKYEGLTITKEHWLIAHSCSPETRLRVLGWKICHNIFPTAVLLSKMGIVETNKCAFCPEDIDFIEHFFYNCRVSKKLWCHVERMLNVITDGRINLSEKNVLFGFTHAEMPIRDQRQLVNLCILVGKMCISKFKYGSGIHIEFSFDTEMRARVKQVPLPFRGELYRMLGV